MVRLIVCMIGAAGFTRDIFMRRVEVEDGALPFDKVVGDFDLVMI